jgi:hypothetical protein
VGGERSGLLRGAGGQAVDYEVQDEMIMLDEDLLAMDPIYSEGDLPDGEATAAEDDKKVQKGTGGLY